MSFNPNNNKLRGIAIVAALTGSTLVAACTSSSKQAGPNHDQLSSSQSSPAVQDDTVYKFEAKTGKGNLTVHADGSADYHEVSTGDSPFTYATTIYDIACTAAGSIITGAADFQVQSRKDEHDYGLALSRTLTAKHQFCDNGKLASGATDNPQRFGWSIGIEGTVIK